MNRVVITMEGGLIQDIMSDVDLDVLVLDFDTDGAEPDELIRVGSRKMAEAVRSRSFVKTHPDEGSFVREFYDYTRAPTLAEEQEMDKEERAKAHAEKYDALCRKYGVSWDPIQTHLGRTLRQWEELYAEDPLLNNVPLSEWDGLALSFMAYHRADVLSLSEVVCMEKHACRRMIEARV